jgi:hypothetical protein
MREDKATLLQSKKLNGIELETIQSFTQHLPSYFTELARNIRESRSEVSGKKMGTV